MLVWLIIMHPIKKYSCYSQSVKGFGAKKFFFWDINLFEPSMTFPRMYSIIFVNDPLFLTIRTINYLWNLKFFFLNVKFIMTGSLFLYIFLIVVPRLYLILTLYYCHEITLSRHHNFSCSSTWLHDRVSLKKKLICRLQSKKITDL